MPSDDRLPQNPRWATAAALLASLCLLIVAVAWYRATPRPAGLEFGLLLFALGGLLASAVLFHRHARSVARVEENRLQAEHALRQSEERLKLALEAAGMGTWDSNLLTGELVWSGSVEPLFGLPLGSFAGTREAFYELVHADDREFVRQAVTRAAEEGADFDVEHRIVRPDGAVRWLANRGRVYRDGRGNSIHMLGTVVDITEHKHAERALRQSEERIRLIVDTAYEAFIAIDAEGRITDWNAQAETTFGWTRSEAVGACLAELIVPPSYREAHALGLKRFLETGEGPYLNRRIELSALHREGHEFPVELTANAIRRGKSWIFAAFIHDIAQRKESERQLQEKNRLLEETARSEREAHQALKRNAEELRRSREELRVAKEAAEKANRAKSEFLANMSHEIRTPMNGIMGMTELLANTRITDQQREYLHLVQQSADALLRLLNDILDFSKIEAGKLELESIDFNLRDTLGDTLQTLVIQASRKGLELAYHIPPEVPDALVGDAGRLRQIVVNLVGNAIKFTQHGEVVLNVDVESVSEANAQLHLAVRDTGIGIPKEKQQLIFQAFSQVDSSTSRRFGGTGLGLAISSQLVAMMGGRMWVESEPDRGSTFHFTAGFARRAEGTPAPGAEPASLQHLPVLVVDDNRTNRLILEEMLVNWGMAPTLVAGGPEALKELERAAGEGGPFRVVLIDAMMPGTDGLSLAGQIRERGFPGNPALLILSSAGNLAETQRFQELGVARCLTKPVKQSDLLDAITAAVGTAAVDREAPSGEDWTAVSRRVLLVEDGLINQRVAVDMLKQRGHRVTVAGNGKEALAALEKEPFDLVLMDIQMPEMDGLEATAAIRKKEESTAAHLPIIAMTAHAMKGDRERCLAAGMDGYISKPIRAQKLYEAVESTVPPIEAEPAETGPASGEVLDWDAAMERVDGKPDLLRKLVDLFVQEGPSMLKQIRAAIDARNAPELRRTAHTLKGSVGIFEARPAMEASFALETRGREADFSAIEEAWSVLQKEVDRLLAELQKRVATM